MAPSSHSSSVSTTTSTRPVRSTSSTPSRRSSRAVAAPLPAPKVSSCSAACWGSSARRPRPFRPELSAAPGGAIAASPETQHSGGDILVEELVEELSLGDVDRGLHLLALAATSDPRGDAVGDHLGAHANVHERVVVLGDVHGHFENEAGVLDDPPAPFPASLASRVVSQTDGFVDDDALTASGRAAQQAPDALIEITSNPVDERRCAIVEVRKPIGVLGELADGLHGAGMAAAVADAREGHTVCLAERSLALAAATVAVGAELRARARASPQGAVQCGGHERAIAGVVRARLEQGGHRRNSIGEDPTPGLPLRPVTELLRPVDPVRRRGGESIPSTLRTPQASGTARRRSWRSPGQGAPRS